MVATARLTKWIPIFACLVLLLLQPIYFWYGSRGRKESGGEIVGCPLLPPAPKCPPPPKISKSDLCDPPQILSKVKTPSALPPLDACGPVEVKSRNTAFPLVIVVIGTESEAIRLFSPIAELRKRKTFDTMVVYSGFDKDGIMPVLNLFDISVDVFLEMGPSSQSLAERTSRILSQVGCLFSSLKPDVALVHGDTTTSMLAGMAAFLHQVRVAHVDAGFRSKILQSPFPFEMNGRVMDPFCFGIKRTNASVCSGFGICEDGNPPVCVCDDFHTDPECETKIHCGLYDFDNNATCNRHGDCRYAHENCTCWPGIWGGQYCEIPFCNGLIGDDEYHVCNGSGNCTDYNKCECDSLHLGEWCGIDEKCFDFEWSDHFRVCRGRGLCIKKDVCECYDGYSGEECDNAGCFKFNSSDPQVCNANGRCWRVDMCMCHDRWYGQKCEENLPEKTVYVKGMTTDINLQFFLPYVAPVKYMLEQESPIHQTEFPCNARLFNFSGTVCGKDARCVWVPGENENFTAGVNVTITDHEADVYTPSALSKLSVVLLTSFSDLFRASMQVQSMVEAPVEIDNTDYVTLVSIIAGPLICVGCLCAIVFIIIIVVVTKAQRKKQREAEESLMSRNRELLEVQEMYLAETEKMADRMRKLAEGGQGTGEILRLDEMGPANNVMMAEEVRDILWSYNCVCHSATWGGKKFIAKVITFDDMYVAEDFRKAIISFGTLPPHPNIRCLPAYYEKNLGLDDGPTTSGFAPKLKLPIVQSMGDEKTPESEPEPEDKTILPVPTVGALVESCAHGDVIAHLDERRSEARQLLGGVEVRTGVRVTQKVEWLLQIVSGLRFLFTHGIPCEEFNTKCIVVDSNEDCKLDSNYAWILCKDLIQSPFAAPELVRRYAKEIEEDLSPEKEEEAVPGAKVAGDDFAAGLEGLLAGIDLGSPAETAELAPLDPFADRPTPTPGQVETPGADAKEEVVEEDDEGKFLSYSFGMVAYCIFVESSNPYCMLPRQGEDLLEYGRLAALSEDFRPSTALPDWVLPTWSLNLLAGCWKEDPEERISLDVVQSQLTAVLAFEEQEEIEVGGDEDDDERAELHPFEEWED